jgi:hypothetical protein
MLINNLSQFKKAMVVGSKWNFIDSRNSEVVTVRTCLVSNSNSFALDNHHSQYKAGVSWLEYPKAKEIIFIQEEGQATKVRINLSNEVYIIYQPIV